ncbi:MAG: amino acid adenylation domain-containing protein [Acidihalobacter sp.]|uniref:amino acid adenylation domain-containing protein n=1 Tax=Acidihalobacter sp. TaxID=1872108 RepID=UPI00307E1762
MSDTHLETGRKEVDQPDASHGASDIDEALRAEIAADLGVSPTRLKGHTSLIQLGMDSMRLMAWLNRLRKRGHSVTLKELYDAPSLVGWTGILQRKQAIDRERSFEPETWPVMRDGEAFELTPVQHAYFVGRSPQQTLGGVGCHLYQEFDGSGLSSEVLEAAIHALIERHPMLRVTFRDDGLQQYRAASHWPSLTVHDLRNLGEQECVTRLQTLRERLGHRMLAVDCGETFDFQLSLLPGGRQRLHVNIDLLVLDAASFTLVFEELAELIRGATLPTPCERYDFRSYLAQLGNETQTARERARRYWLDRLESLPAAPALPLAREPEQIDEVRISRRRTELKAVDWEAFKTGAGASGVTPTMALATCFGAVLARWSNQPRLLLNLTLFDRQPLHPAVERMIADFTNVLLIDLVAEGAPFDELARSNQSTFAEAHEHRHWSGVELLRELRKGQTHRHGAPVVFTSNLGRPLYGDGTGPTLGEPGWGVSQTPQVWIDHLAFEHGSSVWLQWDSNDELFPPALIDAMFDAYVSVVRLLLADATAWRMPLPDLMSVAQRAVRLRANQTAGPIPEGLLHHGFFLAAERSPEAVALIHGEQSLTYAELADQAKRCAGALVGRGVRPGDTVAISMSKGMGQVIAVLGILQAGAVYVPVALDQPEERRLTIYRDADVAAVLVCADDVGADGAPDDAAPPHIHWQIAILHKALEESVSGDPLQPAYIIYTSGSTGTPKGVVISHRGAMNTCVDLNRRYRICSNDRVLALSALHFDLSVYDIFGLLAAGGALILVSEAQRRDPSVWCDMIERHSITIWNTVPALFDMLLTYSEGLDLRPPARLRAVMLSGDWIGLDLPRRYRAFRSDGDFVSMGGATEASIWSNVFDVREVPPHWRSIPYGFPLANQRYRVVDEQGRDCPDWVPGELWIGGEGIALGYFNDPERTARQFVETTNGRWYRTGDTGCYWPDGTLEFLGRRDKQVKIGGYRIELGEIEAALHRIDGVRSGVVLAMGGREKSLAAFVVAHGDELCSRRHADPALPSDYGSLFGLAVPEAEREMDIERLIADFLNDHLRRHGLDFAESVDVDEVVRRYGAEPRWRGLIVRWLNLLVGQGRLALDVNGDRYVRGRRYGEATWLPANEDSLHATAEALLAHHTALAQILRGQRAAQTLLAHPFWSPEHLLIQSRGMVAAIDALAEALAKLSHTLNRPVRLVEIGARSGLIGETLLNRLDASHLDYTALDSSQEMVTRASDRLAVFSHATVRRWDDVSREALVHKGDVVLAANALHRLDENSMDALSILAGPAALVHVLELRRASCLTMVCADLLAPDEHGISAQLRGADEWLERFGAMGLRCQLGDDVGDHLRFALRAPNEVRYPDPRKLVAALGEHLPSYMLPQRLHFIDALPLTANGKIDHKVLAARCGAEQAIAAEQESPRGDAEAAVAGLWQELLRVPVVHRHSHFFQLGGDSLLATRLMGRLDQAGYTAHLGDLFNYPTLAAFAATLATANRIADALRPDPATRHEPFPLTDVQQAYLVGREPGFSLGGVGSHFFVEFEVEDLDTQRFEAAWDRLIARHDMLRAVVLDGRQQVLAEVPRFALRCHRVASFDGPDAIDLRERLSHQVLNPARWPVFDVQMAEDGSGRSHLFVCLDNLMLDGLSMQILLAELEQLYLSPDSDLPALDVGFRDYLIHHAGREPVEASLEYWHRRLDELPPAPQLPLLRDPAEIGRPRFVRLSDSLSVEEWRKLKVRVGEEGLTPSALLLSAYAAVLSAWSARADLCLNLTLFDRRPVHPQIERVLGDFTSLLLLAWQPESDWRASARRLQARLRQDLAHRDVSALWVMRQLALRRGQPSAAMPVVFTSALGFEHDRFLAHASWLKPRWGISQTPQIWLDHQVYESEGELRFNWDAVEALFDPEQLSAMFAQYTELLRRLAVDPAAWNLQTDTLVSRRCGHTVSSVPVESITTAIPESLQVDNALVDELRHHFRQVVGQPIAARQTFFEAGATSLKLVQLHSHLRQAGHASLAVTDLFAHATPYALAAHLGTRPGAEGTPRHHPEPERLILLSQRKARAGRRGRDQA